MRPISIKPSYQLVCTPTKVNFTPVDRVRILGNVAELHPYSWLPTTLPEAQALIAQLQQKLQWSELQRSALEEQLRLRRIEKYGAGSEKLSNLQLELLEEEPGVSQAEVEAESERPPLNGETTEVVIHRKRKANKHPGRQTLPPHLPRVEQVIVCPTEQCTCGVLWPREIDYRLRGK